MSLILHDFLGILYLAGLNKVFVTLCSVYLVFYFNFSIFSRKFPLCTISSSIPTFLTAKYVCTWKKLHPSGHSLWRWNWGILKGNTRGVFWYDLSPPRRKTENEYVFILIFFLCCILQFKYIGVFRVDVALQDLVDLSLYFYRRRIKLFTKGNQKLCS